MKQLPVGTQFTVTQQAPEGSLFAPGSWDKQIGKTVPVTWDDNQAGEAKLLGYTLTHNGLFAIMNFEVTA